MRSYSPYDNVEKKAYPWLLVTTSLNDSQVMFFEPAKWVAKLRAMKTDGNPLYFKINLAGGHGGSSGRYDRLKETAFRYSFVLDAVGLAKGPSPTGAGRREALKKLSDAEGAEDAEANRPAAPSARGLRERVADVRPLREHLLRGSTSGSFVQRQPDRRSGPGRSGFQLALRDLCVLCVLCV